MKLNTILLALALSFYSHANEINSVMGESGNLTDSQVEKSKDFVHQGIKDQKIVEGCKSADNCEDKGDNGVENAIGKVYTTALPMILSQFKGTSKSKANDTAPKAEKSNTPDKAADKTADTNTGDKAKEKKEDGTDWCIIGAMGYEMFSTVMQDKLQKKGSKTEKEIPDAQTRSLVNLRETHLARKKTATYQATAYGTVTACYAVSIATGQQSMNAQTGIKMGGAALLTTLYMKKAKKHDGLANKVQKVIDDLPKAGECNPWTKSPCFCSEPTSKNLYPAEYQEVCVLNAGNFDKPKSEMGCAASDESGKVSYDEKCKCKATNSCLSSRLIAMNPTLSGSTNLMKQMNAGYELLDSGLYDQAKLDNYSTNAAAMGSKISRQIKNPNPQNVILTDDEKKLAQELSEFVTPELAANIARATPQFPENSIASPEKSGLGPSEISEKSLNGQAIKAGYRNSGGGIRNNGSSDEPGFVMPSFGVKKEDPSNVEIIDFAQRAVNNADVSNAPDTPIFDIISNRYRHNWKKLDEKAQSLE